MPTYGQVFLEDYRSTLDKFNQLTHRAYEEHETRELVSKIGSKTELFLKATAFPSKNPSDNFYSFIEELSNVGFNQTHIDFFHDLRKLYNNAKHAPNEDVALLESTEIVKNSQKTAELIVASSVGFSGRSVRPNSNRVYWIAAWDNYTCGDTEIHVLIPGESEHWLGPPTFDMVNIKALEWDDVKFKLSVGGRLNKPEGLIPQKQLDLFNVEDFLAAFVWEGEYRVLLNILSQHELRQELIAGLNRQDTGHYMQTAFLMAMLDVVSSANSVNDLQESIKAQAIMCYGVPPDYKHTKHFINGLAAFVQQVGTSNWSQISGPKWLTEKQWAEVVNPKASHSNEYMLIDANYTVAMKWKT